MAHTDQVAAQHNLLPNNVRQSRVQTKAPLVLQDTTHLKLAPDLGIVRMYQDQRGQINVVERALKKMREKATLSTEDEELYSLYHENLETMVVQLTQIVMEQVRLHEATTKQSTADVYEAMGISMVDPKKKARHEEAKEEIGEPGLKRKPYHPKRQPQLPAADQPRCRSSVNSPPHDELWIKPKKNPQAPQVTNLKMT